MGLGSEEALVGQEIGEVDHILINQHASDAPSEMGSKGSLNDGIDSVANESLSICRVGDGSQICGTRLRKREERYLRSRLNDLLLLMLRVLLVSIPTSALTSSTTTIATSIVLLVSVLLTTLARLVVLLRSLSLGATLVLLLVSTTNLAEQSADELLGLPVLTALSFLLFLFFGYPHLNSDGLETAKDLLLIESLDSLLGIADSIVHNVSVLGLHLVFIDLLD